MNRQRLKTLQEHLDFIEKKLITGSATQYEILSTKVKISSVESMGIDLQTNLKNQITELEAFDKVVQGWEKDLRTAETKIVQSMKI